MNVTDLERFERMIEHTPNGCWRYQGARNDGYGIFTLEDETKRRQVRAHRWYYEQVVGPIPAGLTLDHTCHKPPCPGGASCLHRRCVNPEHLEPVTNKENRARQNHAAMRAEGTCANGHPVDQNDHGKCKQCHRDRSREHQQRRAVRKDFDKQRSILSEGRPEFWI